MTETFQVVALDGHHDRKSFSCGEPSLDRYLKEQVNQDQKRALARCYVMVGEAEPTRILGYYTLSAHSVRLHDLPDDARKGVPYREVPGVIIGRLAVSSTLQGQGMGERLLAAAVEHCTRLESQLGLRVIVVDALSERAAKFYEKFGFTRFEGEELRLFLGIKQARK